MPAEVVDEALWRLAGSSLLTFSVDGATVTAYRLVMRVIRERLARQGRLAATCQAAAAALFRAGDPLVAQDPSDGYYLESSALQDSNGQLDHSAAEPLVKRINGVARAAAQDFRPAHLRGR